MLPDCIALSLKYVYQGPVVGRLGGCLHKFKAKGWGPSKQETTITQSNEAVGGWGPARWYNKPVDLQEVTEIACQRIARCLITQQALQTTDCPVHRSLEVIVSTRVCDHRSGQYFPQFW